MKQFRTLFLTNTLTRNKEIFKPVNPGHVGMYVCGPTVYGDAHLGHARPAITFDLVFRYLQHIGYKVRYVRNITDVGHLEHDADEGEDKMLKGAKREHKSVMEIAKFYTDAFFKDFESLQIKMPDVVEPATNCIDEFISFTWVWFKLDPNVTVLTTTTRLLNVLTFTICS